MIIATSNNNNRDFPGRAVDRTLPAKAGDTGSIPDLGSFCMPWSNWTHEPQLLNLHAATTESYVPVLCNKRSHRNEMHVHHKEESPSSAQLKKAHAQQRDPVQPKVIIKRITGFIEIILLERIC